MAKKVSFQDKVSLAKKFAGHVVPGVVRPLHVLWNQIIGFFFLVLAIIGFFSAVKSYRAGNTPQLMLASTFVLIMAIFGISSFWRARKLSRT
jgi:hypothetical protein